MILLVGLRNSVFFSLDRLDQANAVSKDQENQAKNWTGQGLPRVNSFAGARTISTYDIFQFPLEGRIIIKEYLMANYLYEDPLNKIKWKLSLETKFFGKINCQKATANYKGRNWIAWFAPDIQYENGPWKLYGLPGLILETYDEKREVQFLFNGFESLENNNVDKLILTNLIEIPKNVIK